MPLQAIPQPVIAEVQGIATASWWPPATWRWLPKTRPMALTAADWGLNNQAVFANGLAAATRKLAAKVAEARPWRWSP
jgi:hypothetical protein